NFCLACARTLRATNCRGIADRLRRPGRAAEGARLLLTRLNQERHSEREQRREEDESEDRSEPPEVRGRKITTFIVRQSRPGGIGRDHAHDASCQRERQSKFVHWRSGNAR